LVYHDERKLAALPDEHLDAIVEECGGWVGELERNGQHVFSSGLQCVRSASTLRSRGGQLSVTDGPFAETKEFLGGFTIFEARDLNEAIQIASKMPAVQVGTIEVRPALDSTLEMPDPLDRKIAASVRRASHAGTL
jgi:hypothetical protein